MTFRTLVAAMGLALSPCMSQTLLLLPVNGDLEKASDLSTVNGLYRDVWQAQNKGAVRFGADSTRSCLEKACAQALGQAAKADEVVFSSVRKLGEKWIFSSTLVDVKSGEAYSQRATAVNIEDLEAVTQRVADALKGRKTLEQVATTENITGKEEDQEPVRRRSLYSSGFSLGYLYPFGNAYSYRQVASYDTLYRPIYTEKQPYSAMIRLGWLNRWEFRDDMALNFDAVWSMPNDIGGDIVLQYMFGKTDYTPFVGGGLGVHYVIPDGDNGYGSNHRDSGPTALAQGGILLFRTYDIHVIAKAQYQAIFNSDVDNGMAFDVGVIYQPREKRHSGGGGGIISVLGYTLLGILVLGMIGSIN